MKICGERIALAPFDESDRALFIEMSMSAELMKHVYEPMTLQQAEAAFQVKSQPWSPDSDQWLSLSITQMKNQEKLGNMGLRIINPEAKIAEIGYLLKQDAHGKGYIAEAIARLKQFAFDDLQMNKLVAYCSTENIPSYKSLERSGFLREGCLRQNTCVNGRYVDDFAYGLCRVDQ
ncbi:MAG: GNAT family N-acetyltransferase [Cellvibrionaceae bacterium]|nr:GNAT family N-acetyltransferase [Cellvibrionaceae bacterium]